MNFDDAIAAHTKWRTRLRMFIAGQGEKLDSAAVCKDNACDLGKWIYGEAVQYKNTTAYAALQREHANFHRCAGDVVKKVEAGDAKAAEALVERGAFVTASTNTIAAIRQMKKEVGAA